MDRKNGHIFEEHRAANPGLGLFETLLVVGDEPVELEAHLRRLGRSLQEVYARSLPDTTELEARRAATGICLGRLRVAVAPAGDDLGVAIRPGDVDPATVLPAQGAFLRTHAVGGGLGPHKWADRRDIDRPVRGEAGALIVDRGEVLEAGWANVFAVRDGSLLTPPLDGRLLPGTARAAVLRLATEKGIDLSERTLRPEDLLAADEVFLTGSVRGIEPAEKLDGRPLPGCGPVSRRLADALRQRWRLPGAAGDPAAPAAGPRAGQRAR